MNIGLNSPLFELSEAVDADGPRKGKPSRSLDLLGWQKKFLVVALVTLFIGVGIQLYGVLVHARGEFATGIHRGQAELFSGRSVTVGTTDSSGLQGVRGLELGPAAATAQPAPTGADGAGEWSPLFHRLSFGLFAGFALGYALRMFLKPSLVVGGVVLLSITGLSMAGLLEMDWIAIQGGLGEMIDDALEQLSSLEMLLEGRLPAAVGAMVGATAGFLRR